MGVEPNAQLFDWREPERGQKAGFGKWKNPHRLTTYLSKPKAYPIHRDIGVHKVQDLPLKPWKRLGGRASRFSCLGTEGMYGLYVVEVPGAGALNPERHLYEEVFFVVEGRGTTEVWNDKSKNSPSNGHPARSSRFRSMLGTKSSTLLHRPRCCLRQPRRQTSEHHPRRRFRHELPLRVSQPL